MEALEELCQQYWFPVYAYVRRSGHDLQDAEDITQDFFARFFARGSFRRAEEGNGRFRSYVLGAVRNHLISAHHASVAERRGGKVRIVSLDQEEAEARLAETVSFLQESLERQFDHEWALAVVEVVMGKLRDEYAKMGRPDVFELLHEAILGDAGGPIYRRAAEALSMKESSARVAAHRLRDRYRRLLREEVADLLDDPAEEAINEEIRYLFEALVAV